MKIRTSYEIQQIEQVTSEDKLKAKAKDFMAYDFGKKVVETFGGNITRESPTEKYPYGRYLVDFEVEVSEF